MLKRPDEELTREQQRALEKALAWMEHIYPRLYLALVHHKTTGDQQMTFIDKPWLRSIYKDNSRLLVFMKCVQVGITEFCICDMFSLAKQGKRGLYLLPDDGWVGLWVKDRIDGLLERSHYYKHAVKRASRESDSTRLKSLFGQTWKFAGTHSKTAAGDPKHAHEFAADCIIIDEYDEHDQADLNMFFDRLAASKSPHVRILGNPSIAGRGISEEFNKTDAKKYFIPCHCGHYQVLDWHKHFVEETSPSIYEARDVERRVQTQNPEDDLVYDDDLRPVCEECHEPFDRNATGEWRKTNTSVNAVGSGYSVTRMFISVENDDIRKMFKKFKDAGSNQSLMQEFYNKWLGKTYTNSQDALTEEALEACVRQAQSNVTLNLHVEQAENYQRSVAGIDQGADFHIVISQVHEGIPRLIFAGRAHSWEQVNVILDHHGVSYVVCDAQGGGYFETRKFVAEVDGAWMCYYRPKDQVKELYVEAQEQGVLNTNRTEICDTMVDSFKTQKQILPSDWKEIDNGDFKKQMLMPQRVTNAQGKPEWTKGQDHYFHAYNYHQLALLVSGIYNSIQEEQTSWRVSTA